MALLGVAGLRLLRGEFIKDACNRVSKTPTLIKRFLEGKAIVGRYPGGMRPNLETQLTLTGMLAASRASDLVNAITPPWRRRRSRLPLR